MIQPVHGAPRSPGNGKDNAFAVFYRDALTPILRQYERRRLARLLMVAAMVVLAGASAHWLGRTVLRRPAAAPLYALGGVVLGYFLALRLAGIGYRKEFKRDVVARIAAFASPELSYDPGRGITKAAFLSSRIQTDFNRFFAKDHFSGRIGGADSEFSVVQAIRTFWFAQAANKFQGIHLVISLDRNDMGTILILPKHAGSPHGWSGYRHKAPRASTPLSEIRPGDADFTSFFRIYASDRSKANGVFTVPLMKQLCDLRRCFGNDISLSLVDSRLHVAFTAPGDRFEPRLYRSLLDIDMCREIFESIRFFVDAIEMLASVLRASESRMPKKE